MLPIIYEFTQEYIHFSEAMVERTAFFVYLRTLQQEMFMGTTFYIGLN